MNLFNGMTDREEISFVLAFLLFNFFAMLEVAALAAFYITSKPRRGRVRSAALWHMGAAVVFMVCLISTVWAAPAEKAFIDADGDQSFLAGARFGKVLVGLGFAAGGVALMVIGLVAGARQRREAAQEALLLEA